METSSAPVTSPVQNSDVPAPTVAGTPPVPPVSPKRSGMGKWVVFLVLVLLAIGAYAAWSRFASSSNQSAQPTGVVPQESAAGAVVTVDTENASISAGMVSVPIVIDTGDKTVSAVKLHITYSPVTLTGVAMQPGPFFANPTILDEQISETPGEITYTLGSLSARKGTDVLAVFSWTKPESELSSVTVTVTDQTEATAIGENSNVIDSTGTGTVSY